MTPKEELAQLASARTESGVELFLAELGRPPFSSSRAVSGHSPTQSGHSSSTRRLTSSSAGSRMPPGFRGSAPRARPSAFMTLLQRGSRLD